MLGGKGQKWTLQKLIGIEESKIAISSLETGIDMIIDFMTFVILPKTYSSLFMHL